MKLIIKDLVEELTTYKKTFQAQKYLFTADKKIEFSELSMLITRLLTWNKLVAIDKIPIKTERTSEYMLISNVSNKMYSNLFENCPELKEIFAVEQDRVKFNENLTVEEKEEIRQFINENYTVTFRMTVRLK